MHPPDVTLKIGQMIQALKLHHELCRDEMPSSDCSYLKRIWLVLGLDECRFGLVLKTSLSRGGAFMEEQMLLFPLPVENLHAQFVWKMNSFFFFFLVLDAVLWQSSEVPFAFFWHWKFPLVCLPLSYSCNKHAYGHVQPPICPLPWNCHGALAMKWFCGKWSVGIRVGSSICFKSWVLWACLICRADF